MKLPPIRIFRKEFIVCSLSLHCKRLFPRHELMITRSHGTKAPPITHNSPCGTKLSVTGLVLSDSTFLFERKSPINRVSQMTNTLRIINLEYLWLIVVSNIAFNYKTREVPRIGQASITNSPVCNSNYQTATEDQ